uniref:Uncharacterized protein n=1 Tax=Staphylococcus phage UHP46 TaxID=3234966 RepID=A0AB39C7T1_9CAUD
MNQFKKDLTVQILQDYIYNQYLGDLDNQLLDEEITQEEYAEAVSLEAIKDFTEGVLSHAYSTGYLVSPIDNRRTVEAKHIKFSGKDNIEMMVMLASAVCYAIHQKEIN